MDTNRGHTRRHVLTRARIVCRLGGRTLVVTVVVWALLNQPPTGCPLNYLCPYTYQP